MMEAAVPDGMVCPKEFVKVYPQAGDWVYVTLAREMIALCAKTAYVGFDPGAPLTAKDVTSQATVKVKAVYV